MDALTATALTRTAIDDCATAVTGLFDAVFERIEQWRTSIEGYVADRDGIVSSAGIDALVQDLLMREFADARGSVIGAGFVAAPGFIPDANWHLAWWLGDLNTFGMGAAAPRIRRLDAVEDPADESFRDYTTLEWWRVPAGTGRRHITGPYVDYLCTDDYTLTLTAPACRGDAMIGVVGADLYVEDVERTLLPRLGAVGSAVTLVNSSGRVVVSTDAHLPTGSLLRLDGLAEVLRAREQAVPTVRLEAGQEVIWCGGTGLALVVTPALP